MSILKIEMYRDKSKGLIDELTFDTESGRLYVERSGDHGATQLPIAAYFNVDWTSERGESLTEYLLRLFKEFRNA